MMQSLHAFLWRLPARTVIVGPLPGHEGVLQNVVGSQRPAPNGLSGIAGAPAAINVLAH